MIKKAFYPLADGLSQQDVARLGITRKEIKGCPMPSMGMSYRNIKAVPTGDMRKPNPGEWFLSGAVVEAYRHGGKETLSTAYYIAKLVLTVTTVAVSEVEVK